MLGIAAIVPAKRWVVAGLTIGRVRNGGRFSPLGTFRKTCLHYTKFIYVLAILC